MPPEAVPQLRISRDIAGRWGGDAALLVEGFVAVPTAFLKYCAQLKPYPLTVPESAFVLQLMVFKWDAKAPFPSYKTLAERMGVSVQYARRIARNLGTKGYLFRQVRYGMTNRFDLQPLFDALVAHAKAEDSRKKKGAKSNIQASIHGVIKHPF